MSEQCPQISHLDELRHKLLHLPHSPSRVPSPFAGPLNTSLIYSQILSSMPVLL